MDMTDKRPLKVFPSTGSGHRLSYAHADREAVPQGDDMRGLGGRAGGVLPPYRDHARLKREGVDVWLDKEKPCGERSRTILPGADWELEIRKAARVY
jgi:hypothetical protein